MENPLPDTTWARIGIYTLYSVMVFVVALAVTFPDDQLADIAEVRLEDLLMRRTQNAGEPVNYSVQVGDVDIWWIGAELETVRLKQTSLDSTGSSASSGGSNSGTSKTKKKKKKTSSTTSSGYELSVPTIGARFAPIDSIMQGGIAFDYHIGIGGGSISGMYARGSSAQTITLNINGVELRKSRLLSELINIPAFGRLEGSGRFEMALNRPLLTGGSFELQGEKLTIGPSQNPKLSVPAGPKGGWIPLSQLPIDLSIPQTNFGNMDVRVNVDYQKGTGPPTLVVETFTTQGRDLKTQIWQTVRLGETLGQAQAKLKMRVNFTPDFIETNELTPLLQQSSFRNGRNGDWYGFILWGPLNSLNFEGSSTAAKGPKEGSTQGGPSPQTGSPGKAPPKNKKGAPKKENRGSK